MRLSLLLPALLLVPLLVSSAAVATIPDCAAITTNSTTPYGPYLLPVNSQVYNVWLETNLVQGLQREACLGSDGQQVEPDRNAGTYGLEHGGQPVCIFRVGCIWI